MNEKEIQSILHSDIELWEAATEENGEKFLMLPYGIGKVAISMEGIEYGPKRAQAVGGFGKYIRGAVKDRISDEAIESRAIKKAADARDAASDFAVGLGDDLRTVGLGRDPGKFSKVSDKETVASPDEITFTPKGMASRAGFIRDRIAAYEHDLNALKLELRGVEAYLEVCKDASEDTKTPQSGEDAAQET